MSSFLESVKEQLDEGTGYWHSCSGCHESVDGYSVTPVDPVFRCAPGSGCRECGGIGVIWDSTDYADFVRFTQERDASRAAIEAMRETTISVPHPHGGYLLWDWDEHHWRHVASKPPAKTADLTAEFTATEGRSDG